MVFQGKYANFKIDRIEKLHDWLLTVGCNDISGYGRATNEYAAAWASLMEERMSDGAPLAEIADIASRDADTKGITGFMYGCAVSILSQVWVHGEDLRKWSNRKYDDKADEHDNGGVINPAIMTIV